MQQQVCHTFQRAQDRRAFPAFRTLPHLAMKISKLKPIVSALMEVELPDIRNDFDSSLGLA